MNITRASSAMPVLRPQKYEDSEQKKKREKEKEKEKEKADFKHTLNEAKYQH